MMNVKINEKAADDLIKLLKNLPRNVMNKVIRQTINEESKDLLKAIKDVTPVKTGALKRSIGNAKKSYTRKGQSGDIISTIGVRVGWQDSKTNKVPMQYYRKVFNKNPWMKTGFDNWLTSGKHNFEAKLGSKIEQISNNGGN